MSDRTTVTLTEDWTDPAGNSHRSGDSVSVDQATADQLVRLGKGLSRPKPGGAGGPAAFGKGLSGAPSGLGDPAGGAGGTSGGSTEGKGLS